ncbi:MAG TPA: PAS domain S-box protein [Opitutaceae bacterium]|nr:PAS domain S-box protein [Opitutaceae bacterium]
MLENLELIAVTCDQHGEVTFCNDFLLRLTDRKREDVIGCDWCETFLLEPDILAVKALFTDMVASGTVPAHYTNPIKTRAGERREIHWNNTLLRDPSGKAIGVASIGEDVTIRQREKSALMRVAAIVESSADAIIGKDLAGLITSWNQGAERIFGYTAAEMRGTSMRRLDPTDRPPHQPGLVARVVRGEHVEHFETVHQTRDGRRIDVWVTPSAIKDGAGEIIGVSIVVRDITSRKQAEAELQTAQAQLRALVARLHTVREEEAKRIARELHDDLGQSLTALNMKIRNMEGTLPDANPAQREQFVRMHAIVDHTIETVQKIAGELRLGQLDVFGLAAAIDWQLQEFSRRSGIHGRIIRLDEATGLPDAHSTAVFRILQEALTNVSRHSGATEVEVSLHVTSGQLTLEVHDNGRGILPAELDHHNAIGLLGMRERAGLAGGDVSIRGEPGCGTTVRVTLPLHATTTSTR